MSFSLKCDVKYSNNLSKINQDLQKNKNLKAYVGILQKNNNREQDGETNAEIGFDHEMGSQTKNLPQRSFLRKPIYKYIKKIISLNQMFVKNLIQQKDFSIVKLLTNTGYVVKNIILDFFDTGGDGEWQKLSKKTIEKKGHEEILKDKLQLLRSIDFEVKK